MRVSDYGRPLAIDSYEHPPKKSVACSLLSCPQMVKRLRVLLAATALILFVVTQARAQTDSRLAVGGSITARAASSSESGGSANVGFEWRLGHAMQGWGVQNSIFSWFDTDVQGTVGPGTVGLGNMRIRPIMAGYGYTWVRGRTAITGDVVGGYSFNSFKLDSSAVQEYSRRLGATGIDAEATNAFALKPEIQVWHDLNSRFGLKIDGGYLIARPSVVITSSLGEDIHHIRADTFLVTVGLVYSLF
jgi:hypothetical protein